MIDNYQKYLQLIDDGSITMHRISKHKNILDNFLDNFKHKFNIAENDTFTLELYEKDINFYESLISLINILGYFPSYLTIYNNNNKKSQGYDFNIIKKEIDHINFNKIIIKSEAKFDIEIENIPDKIYHIYIKKYENKILKNGIIPKSRMRKIYHPERCYFTFSYVESINLIKEFAYIDKLNNIDNNYGIISVNTDKLNDVKFYNDPNSIGFYTYDNISPLFIKKLKCSNGRY